MTSQDASLAQLARKLAVLIDDYQLDRDNIVITPSGDSKAEVRSRGIAIMDCLSAIFEIERESSIDG